MKKERQCIYCLGVVDAKEQQRNDGACDGCVENPPAWVSAKFHKCGYCGGRDFVHQESCALNFLHCVACGQVCSVVCTEERFLDSDGNVLVTFLRCDNASWHGGPYEFSLVTKLLSYRAVTKGKRTGNSRKSLKHKGL